MTLVKFTFLWEINPQKSLVLPDSDTLKKIIVVKLRGRTYTENVLPRTRALNNVLQVYRKAQTITWCLMLSL